MWVWLLCGWDGLGYVFMIGVCGGVVCLGLVGCLVREASGRCGVACCLCLLGLYLVSRFFGCYLVGSLC